MTRLSGHRIIHEELGESLLSITLLPSDEYVILIQSKEGEEVKTVARNESGIVHQPQPKGKGIAYIEGVTLDELEGLHKRLGKLIEDNKQP